jgi:hypothetical protein
MQARGKTTSPDTRELAYRADDGLEVRLLWSARDNRVSVAVSDLRSGDRFVVDAANENALDVFYHPYAHADGTGDRDRVRPVPSAASRSSLVQRTHPRGAQ